MSESVLENLLPRSRRRARSCFAFGLFFFKPRSRRLGGFLLCLRFIFFNRAAVGVRGSSFTRGFFLTAQPQACAGLVLHGVFFFFFSFVGDLA